MSIFDDDAVASVRIHPAIGVARLGDHPSAFYFGPERPFETPIPKDGLYKAASGGIHRIKRQAARFRLFAFNDKGKLLGEVTAEDDGVRDIQWTVELANKKAQWIQFNGRSKDEPPRNNHVPGQFREGLSIHPGVRHIGATDTRSVRFDNGKFTDFDNGVPKSVSNIYLGELRIDGPSGRLIVLGGRGRSAAAWKSKTLKTYANNPGWFDDTSDGPVDAKIVLKSGRKVKAEGAWVICAPPRFAPGIGATVTMYDTLRQVAIDKKLATIPAKPSFALDIYPLLKRAFDARFVFKMPTPSTHSKVKQALSPTAPANLKQAILSRVRVPRNLRTANALAEFEMPYLWGDNYDNEDRSGDRWLSVTDAQYKMLEKWVRGVFKITGIDGQVPPTPSQEITPDGLDRAVLEACIGGAFFPGIEAGWMLRDVFGYTRPFRLDRRSQGAGVPELAAGDVTKQMAVPWQADFFDCLTESLTAPGWWPSARPDSVFRRGSSNQVNWVRGVNTSSNRHQDMVDKWAKLGFVVEDKNGFVEVERNPELKG